ncbi:MAG TPA: hypothetical protein VHS05_05365 [Pyrinomonadaceae bacterium]|nr:hypothetical protein [Pyrinomonadaceae bacterium]
MDSASVRKLVPKSVKRPIKSFLLRRQLRRAIEKIRRLPKDVVPSRELLSELMAGWGNEGYAANLDYLEEVAKRAVSAAGPVLECGSGATTILLGVLCAKREIEVWSLEHSPEWRARIVELLERSGISGSGVCSAPLVEYGEFDWYDPPLAKLPKNFALVICDGPPGSTKGGRYGLLPVMNDRLESGSYVLVDDAGRPAEAEMIARWEREFQFETETFNAQGGKFAVMRRR